MITRYSGEGDTVGKEDDDGDVEEVLCKVVCDVANVGCTVGITESIGGLGIVAMERTNILS